MSLPETERFALLGGPYTAPQCRVGSSLNCRLRGQVRVVAMSVGRIPWPIVAGADGRGRGLALCGELVDALHQESNLAVAHWWGTPLLMVTRWRKALGLGHGLRGRTPAPHVMEAARKANRKRKGQPGRKGWKHSPETRRKMSEAAKARGAPPQYRARKWTPEEDALLGTVADRAIAAKFGVHQSTVTRRRQRLEIANIYGAKKSRR